MTEVAGKLMTLTIDGSAVGYSTSFSISMNESPIDVTNRDTSWWKRFLRGMRDWSVDFTSFYSADDVGKKVLMTIYDTHADVSAAIILTLADGTVTLSGNGILSGLSLDGPHDAGATFSGTIQGTDALAQSVS